MHRVIVNTSGSILEFHNRRERDASGWAKYPNRKDFQGACCYIESINKEIFDNFGITDACS